MRHWLEKVNLLTTTVILIFALALSACQPALTSVPAAVQPLATASPAPTLSLAPPEATPTLSHTAALSELLNEVKARTIARVDWEAATDGQRIHTGGGVRTGDESRARLDISDGTIIRMAANSEFELMELRGEAADAVTRLTLATGKLWMSVTVTLGGVFEIETPTGTATVRGSYMTIEFFDATGQMVITCLEGLCRLTGTSGKFTDLTDGQQAEIPAAGQDPSPAKPMDAAQYADWAQNFPGAPVPTATPSPTSSPTNTPPPTNTPTPTRTPAPTSTPKPTAPPLTFILLSSGDTQCLPNTVPAGVVQLGFGAGRWPTAEEAAATIGDSWPTITLDGQPVTVGSRTGPEWYTGNGPAGWGFDWQAYITLDPGEYTFTGQWNQPGVDTCTITVTSP